MLLILYILIIFLDIFAPPLNKFGINFPFIIRPEDLLIFFWGFYFLISFLSQKSIKVPAIFEEIFGISLLLVLTSSFLAIMFNIRSDYDTLLIGTLKEVFRYIKYYFITVLSYKNFSNKKRANIIFKAIIAFLTIQFFISIFSYKYPNIWLQIYHHLYELNNTSSNFVHVFSYYEIVTNQYIKLGLWRSFTTFYNPNGLAAFFFLGVLAAIILYMKKLYKKGFIVLIISIIGVILTQSRTYFIVSLYVLTVFIFGQYLHPKVKKRLVTFLILIVIMLIVTMFKERFYLKRFLDFSTSNGSVRYRIERFILIPNVVFENNPLFGLGPYYRIKIGTSFGPVMESEYIYYLAWYGLIGLLFWIYIYLKTLKVISGNDKIIYWTLFSLMIANLTTTTLLDSRFFPLMLTILFIYNIFVKI